MCKMSFVFFLATEHQNQNQKPPEGNQREGNARDYESNLLVASSMLVRGPEKLVLFIMETLRVPWVNTLSQVCELVKLRMFKSRGASNISSRKMMCQPGSIAKHNQQYVVSDERNCSC